MDWLESKYIGLVSSRLRNYKRKSREIVNFSCPFCGDSPTNPHRARGYVYTSKGSTMYHCHNCNITYGFNNFLKNLDYNLYSEFLVEKLKDSGNNSGRDLVDFVAKMRTPTYLKDGPLASLKKVSQLKADHPCKVLVSNRKIPNEIHHKLFWCPEFMQWSNTIVPGKFDQKALRYDEGRLLIPFLNKEGMLHAFQGRALDSKANPRYITIVNDETRPKIFGLDRVDFSAKTYVLEGPIDSMFLPNSIATAGGDLVSTTKDVPKSNLVIVYDNEPRNPDTVKKLDKAIINGYKVCIWPINMGYKDVNDAIMGGLSREFVQYIIDTNTYSDLKAKMALNAWSKS